MAGEAQPWDQRRLAGAEDGPCMASLPEMGAILAVEGINPNVQMTGGFGMHGIMRQQKALAEQDRMNHNLDQMQRWRAGKQSKIGWLAGRMEGWIPATGQEERQQT